MILSYAITIHKSQGREFPVVIIPMHFQSRMMLQRNLLYKGVTRAIKIVILIGDITALKYAIENDVPDNRKTLLNEKLIKQFGKQINFDI